MKELHKLLLLLSYYNAAEGDNWYEETMKRERTRRELIEEIKRLTAIGNDPKEYIKNGNFLVSESDLFER